MEKKYKKSKKVLIDIYKYLQKNKPMVYEIVTYNLVDKTFHTYKELPNAVERIDMNNNIVFINKQTNERLVPTRFYSYASEIPENSFPHTDLFLPYFADVTEDLPAYIKRLKGTAKTYKNCQLLTEKKGGYLYFYHKETNQKLLIAINSHYYEPIKK